MRKHKTVVIIVTLLIISIVSVVLWKRSKAESNNIPTMKVKFGTFKISLEVTGTLQALNSESITAKGWWGMQIFDLVAEGTFVEEGDFLAKLTHSDLESRSEEAESNLKAAKQQYEQSLADYKIEEMQFDLELQEAEKNKKEAEFKAKEIELSDKSPIEKENAQKTLELAQAQYEFSQQSHEIKIQKSDAKLEEAKFKLEQAQAHLTRYQKRINEMTIYSPSAGLVVYAEDWEGNKIKKGASAHNGQKLIELPDLSQMIVETEVNEVDIGAVKKDQVAEVRLDAFPELVFKGKVSDISTLASVSQNNSGAQVFKVKILLDDTDEKMKPGMTAGVEIIIDEIPEVLFIPQEAVFEKQDTTVVYLQKGVSDEMHIVRLGKNNENNVIIEDGLEKEDVVFLRDPTINIEQFGGVEDGESTDK